ncbi:uncharacterized protein PV07_04397 [Cladophialophora immunda]|uniref:Holocytochrome c-type synthase n=1 Tax=Cladophialophora immunda TaxID=569365 RepID=A0A0D2DB04_9EURO|nr:uncharacterized protein PV07_04397 [Cladophialophora immunda]KIW32884.1 hypothetical protein PV07_04397 [Cladophialophora immunda]
MGWFWADAPKASAPSAPQHSAAAPPPGCPMHQSDTGNPTPFPPRLDPSTSTPSSCPVKSPNHPLRYQPSESSSQSQSSEQRPQQPSSSTLSKLNPLNYMPSLSNSRPADSPQSIHLPLDRELSSIPRSDSQANWEYPSPQQMYNAMLRKGYTDTPAEHVEAMVAVHNFLNEGAWAEIEEWERIFSGGLWKGWETCSRGEQAITLDRARQEYAAQRRLALGLNPDPQEDESKPKLIRFQGRPQEPSPKARILRMLGKVFPDHFSQDPPFDRHDWYISRKLPNGSTKEVRYVIDYYGGGVEQETGQPVFYLDIRPALDSPTAAVERAMRWGGDVWHRASGGAVREAAAQTKGKENGS